MALKVWLILATVIYGLLLFPVALMILFSPMMFDAPGSTSNPYIWILLVTILVYPLVAFASMLFAWIMYRKQNVKIAFLFSLIPVIDIAIGLIDAQFWQ